ncbi:hypothetical protein [Aeoliella sp.]|uniref:hypothetical protein n=1 Tax=Aeoliella sp. TaxID=2795800 RepID=UPI003CCBD8CF
MRSLLILLSVLALQLSATAAEPLKITVSKETTYITEPLDEDGLPDYRRAWLERLRKRKVPAEQNGAVDYWQTVGLEMVDEKYRQAFCDELGMPMPPEEGVLEMVDGAAMSRAMSIWYLRRKGYDVDEDSFDSFEQQNAAAAWEASFWPDAVDSYGATLSYPAAEVPPLKAWLEGNSNKLDRIVAALDNPGWYDPPHSLCGVSKDFSTDLGMRAFEWRGVFASLETRARINLDQGDVESTVRDLVAIRRLTEGRSADTWFDLLISTAGARLNAAPVELLLVEHSQASDHQLRKLQGLWSVDHSHAPLQSTLKGGERLYSLNYTLALLRKEPDTFDTLHLLLPLDDEGDEQLKWIEQALELPIDGDRLLRAVNQGFDRTHQALDMGDTRQVLTILKERRTRLSNEPLPTRRAPELLSPAERADAIVLLTSRSNLSSPDVILEAKTRTAAHSQLMHLALALGRYRLAHGEYPESLDALAPKYVARIPVDAFGNDSFGYRRTDAGFLLYSFGLNGVDDGGSNNDMGILAGYSATGYSDQVRRLLGDEVPGKGLLEGYVPVQSDDIAIRLPLIEVPLPGEAE